MPSVVFDDLAQYYLSNEEKQLLTLVLAEKANGSEKDNWRIPEQLWEHTVKMFENLANTKIDSPQQQSYEEFDLVFRKIVS